MVLRVADARVSKGRYLGTAVSILHKCKIDV